MPLDLAHCWLGQAGNDAQGRRLAAAGRAKQADKIARVDFQGHVAKGDNVLGKGLADILQFEQVGSGRVSQSSAKNLCAAKDVGGIACYTPDSVSIWKSILEIHSDALVDKLSRVGSLVVQTAFNNAGVDHLVEEVGNLLIG